METPLECNEPSKAHPQQRCRQKDQLGIPTVQQKKILITSLIDILLSQIMKIALIKGKLEFMVYLAWHNFSIDATYVDAGIQTGFVVRVNNVTAKCLVNSNPAIIWSLIIRQDKYQLISVYKGYQESRKKPNLRKITIQLLNNE